jgi:hypothetical protein
MSILGMAIFPSDGAQARPARGPSYHSFPGENLSAIATPVAVIAAVHGAA